MMSGSKTEIYYYIDVADTMTGLCKKYDVPPKMLHIEITETAVADETLNNKHQIELLQERGFTVEIDDFGKGSSSLSLLKDIKADVLKIDMGFLNQSEESARGNVILESVIDMAKRLGMEVISEGVETEKQLANLTELGCDMFQGYFFSRPIPVAAFEELVREGFST
ncbi:MAG: EAL domain-containing protein [Lachnospiraceae bacterium]|nr:EAL domain-containing protein [Lachnospiraceae bacterium]